MSDNKRPGATLMEHLVVTSTVDSQGIDKFSDWVTAQDKGPLLAFAATESAGVVLKALAISGQKGLWLVDEAFATDGFTETLAQHGHAATAMELIAEQPWGKRARSLTSNGAALALAASTEGDRFSTVMETLKLIQRHSERKAKQSTTSDGAELALAASTEGDRSSTVMETLKLIQRHSERKANQSALD